MDKKRGSELGEWRKGRRRRVVEGGGGSGVLGKKIDWL